MKYLSDYFTDIPWQRTGLPISAPAWRYEIRDFKRFIERALRFAGSKAGISLPTNRNGFANYSAWLRVEPARNIVSRLLLSNAPLYADYIDLKIAQGLVQEFLQKNDNRFLTTVGLLLTFEIYLRQLFDIDVGILGE